MPQDKLSLHFIVPDGKTKEACSRDMHDAFQACEDLRLQPRWETEAQCMGQENTRQDVFVFDEFEGKLFKSLKTPLCVRVVGARCLLTCMRRNISIPDTRLPVYTAAMHNLSVTTTQLDSELKAEVRQLVTNMGGMYCNSLRSCVTHIVVGHVISVKCQETKKKKVELMTLEWVRAVWEASLTRDIVAVDEEFNKYRCCLFHGVVATCTKLRTTEKNELIALIQTNGGVFTGFLDASTTNLLIVGDPSGDKFQCAQQNDISCLSMQWVRDCVAAGDIMPFEDYVVTKGKHSSTPVHDQSKFLPDFSTVSSIEAHPRLSHVDESLNSTMASMGEASSVADLTLRNLPNAQQVEEAVQQLVASKSRCSVPFLDGCKIFLSGFTTLQMDRLRRVLNWAGATRYDELSESLTHIVIGQVNSLDMKVVKNFVHKPHVLSVQWLVQCAKLQHPAPEDQFLCCANETAPVEPPSPLSKKGVAALQQSVVRNIPVFPALEPVDEASKSPPAAEPEQQPAEDLIHQYLHSQPGDETVENAPLGVGNDGGNDRAACKEVEIVPEQDSPSEVEFMDLTYFEGLVFEILGYEEDSEAEEEIMEMVLALGGHLAQGRSAVDYAITPCVMDSSFSCRAQHAVNYLWLEECREQQQVLPEPLDYFYLTAKVDLDVQPLDGCVLTPSSYMGRERTFLIHLMQALGARVQYVFSRIAVPEKDLLPATHLITQDTSSPKYRAAVKWRLLVVSHEWLLACVSENRRVEEGPFVISSDTSKCNSGEDASLIDKSVVRRTPRKVPQSDGPISRSDVTDAAVAKGSVLPENMGKAAATVQVINACTSHVATPGAEKSHKHPEQTTSSHVNKVATPSVDRDIERSRVANSCMNSASTPVTDRANRLSSVPAEKFGTPVAQSNHPTARKSCLPLQSPASDSPMGPPAFTTPADSRRRLGMLFSQETPLRYQGTEPSTPSTPRDPNYISTPETPYGQFLVTDPSPNTRKNWKRWLDTVPDFPKSDSPAKKRRDSTPVSELKRRIWDTILPNKQQADEGVDLPATDKSQDAQVSDGACTLDREPVASGSSQLTELEVLNVKYSREASSPFAQNENSRLPEVNCRLSMPANVSTGKESDQNEDMKTGPGVHTQIVRLNEALSARKQQENGGVKKRRCVDTDKSNSSADTTVTMEHSKEYKALMGVEVPTEIAVTWEYRQYSEQSEPQTQSQDAAVSSPRVFSLSGMDAERVHSEKVIQALGGKVSQSSNYDPASTHLVCGRLARSERMLGSIAAGKWLLHPSYLTDSEKAGLFLPEERYEWGNPACPVSRQLAPNTLPHALATAAHRWRVKVAQDGYPAFSSLKVLVHVGKDRQDQFKRCVQAGGGKVVLLSEWCTANVCIVDVNKVSLDKPISLASFVRNNIPCVPVLYLHEFLMREPPPTPAEFAIPEYKELCRQRELSTSSSSR